MAALRSASSNTTAAPLPPSSISSRFMVGAPAAAIRWPTAVEPVKDTMSTSGEEVSADAGSGPCGADQVDHAGREPDLVEHPGQLDDGQRVLGGGLDDHRVAHGQGRGHLAGHVGQREVVAGDGGDHADRLAVGQGADQAAGGQRRGVGGDRGEHRLLDVADVPAVAVEPVGADRHLHARADRRGGPGLGDDQGDQVVVLGPDGGRRPSSAGRGAPRRGWRPRPGRPPGRRRRRPRRRPPRRWGPGPPPPRWPG